MTNNNKRKWIIKCITIYKHRGRFDFNFRRDFHWRMTEESYGYKCVFNNKEDWETAIDMTHYSTVYKKMKWVYLSEDDDDESPKKIVHNLPKDEVIDIFKYVLNNDVAKHIASYMAHPIHEYIGRDRLGAQKCSGLRLTWHNFGYKSVNDFIDYLGYLEYKKMRNLNIMIMNNVGHCKGLGRPYLPVKMCWLVGKHTLKKDIMEVLKKNEIKVYKSWTKQKMIKHYYKSII